MKLSQDINEAIGVMRRGGTVVYPTDTVFGLGANALDNEAVKRVYQIKNRPLDKQVPVIIPSIAIAKKLAYINTKTEKILKAIWPGVVTVILFKKSNGTIGLRIPDHPVPIQLAKEFPIIGTSANVSGQPTCQTIFEVQQQFASRYPKPDLILELEYKVQNKPSTILDLTTNKPKILRVGPVSKTQLLEMLKIKN